MLTAGVVHHMGRLMDPSVGNTGKVCDARVLMRFGMSILG